MSVRWPSCRAWAVTLVFLATVGVLATLAVELRTFYGRELERRVWPPAMEKPEIFFSPEGGSSPSVLVIGDSRIAQWPLPQPRFGRLIKAGISGATTAEVRVSLRENLRNYRPDVVVIEAGINDLKLLGVRPALGFRVIRTVKANLAGMVEDCQQERVKVVLLTIWPPGQPEWLRRPVWSAAVPQAVESVNDWLPTLHSPARGIFVTDLPKIVEFHEVILRYRGALHLTGETYRPMTAALECQLEVLLGRDFFD